MASATAPERVPQEERTRAMRARLLDATVQCLTTEGWSGTTTTLVSEKAGVSRGAQLHHFPTKQALVLAAVEWITERRLTELGDIVGDLPAGTSRTRAILEAVVDHFTSPMFTAALELWVAARVDEDLRLKVIDLERRIGAQAHQLTVQALGADESQPHVRELVQGVLDMMRGFGLADLLTDDRPRRSRILDHWAVLIDAQLDARKAQS